MCLYVNSIQNNSYMQEKAKVQCHYLSLGGAELVESLPAVGVKQGAIFIILWSPKSPFQILISAGGAPQWPHDLVFL